MNESSETTDQVEWEFRCPKAITSDPIWRLDAYRGSMFALDLARLDIRIGLKQGLYHNIAAQLLGSVASISGNIGEGYGRATRADRLRFFGYALGSLREAVSWYVAAADFLRPGVTEHRLEVIARIRPLLLGLITATRARNGARGFEA